MKDELADRTRYRMLGTVEVRPGQRWQAIDDVEWRSLLSCLMLRSREPVSLESLASAVWGDAPPPRAGNLISMYVHRLRRVISDPDGRVLVHSASGYQLCIGLGDLDLLQFEALVEDGQRELAAGHPGTAGILLAEALGLWRGPALADVRPTAFLAAQARRLAELRVTAAALRAAADLACGRAAQLAPEPSRLTIRAEAEPGHPGPETAATREDFGRVLDAARISAGLTVQEALARLSSVPGPGPHPAGHDREKAASRVGPRIVPDSPGFDLCPDPLTAETAADLLAALSRFRIWAGEPSFQDMQCLSEPRTAASTMCTALGSSSLPSERVVRAIVTGCGGTQEQLQAFITAWRRIRLLPGPRLESAGKRSLYPVQGHGHAPVRHQQGASRQAASLTIGPR
jgi:hypothetical protein